MPKITCEINTDDKTAVFKVDGEVLDVSHCHVGYCEYSDCCDGTPERSVSICYTTKDDDGKKDMTTSMNFESSPESSMASVARDMNKSISSAIKNFKTSSNLSKAFAKLNSKK